MNIENIFTRDIHRQISGVIKVQDSDARRIWQELDEYVVTPEIERLLSQFFSAYNKTISANGDEIGVWISGFFGSGKSHFLKILSHLFSNRELANPESSESAKAEQFFKSKNLDQFLLAEMHRAVSQPTDAILFNIDSKAKQTDGRFAIVNVFLRVFNAQLGFFEDAPWIAEIERKLTKERVFDDFKKEFQSLANKSWVTARETLAFNKRHTVSALAKVLPNLTEADAEGWFDDLKANYSLSPDGFAQLIKEYLDQKGSKQRIVFLVDEVGQFIGENRDTMLSLQTLAEEFGSKCNGRAWIIVTSQEDIDKVVGHITKQTGDDFSKIQGRFKTRLSLSSANVDQVIKSRLLDKTDQAKAKLLEHFTTQEPLLKNLLLFSSDGIVLPYYEDKADFVSTYPFVPYQFQMLQKVYTEIRRIGATGKHLAHGERSMIDGFQSAAKFIGEQQLGTIVPFYLFYDSIENYLDGSIKSTVTRAALDKTLKSDFDVKILKLLFLVKGLEKEIPPTVENLATFSVFSLSTDKFQLKTDIQESLARLEKQHFIRRNDDRYYFLTDEEQEIQREIQKIEIDSAVSARELGQIVFDELFVNKGKYRYAPLKKDFGFSRLCDGYSLDTRGDELSFTVISPFCDTYQDFVVNPSGLSARTTGIICRIDGNDRLDREFRSWLQTKSFCERPRGSTSGAREQIIYDLDRQNKERRKRVVALLEEQLINASLFIQGRTWRGTLIRKPKELFDQAMCYLVEDTYKQLKLLNGTGDNWESEITTVLTEADTSALFPDGLPHPAATEEIQRHISHLSTQAKPPFLSDLISRFTSIPYGWVDGEIALIVARLFYRSEIALQVDAVLSKREAIEYLTKRSLWKNLKLQTRQQIDEALIQAVQQISKKWFGKTLPSGEEALFHELQELLQRKNREWNELRIRCQGGEYPGLPVLKEGIDLIDSLLDSNSPLSCFTAIQGASSKIEQLLEQLKDVVNFFSSQTKSFDDLKELLRRARLNSQYLEADVEAKRIMSRASAIVGNPNPYAELKESVPLSKAFAEIEKGLLAKYRSEASEAVQSVLNELQSLLVSLELNGKAECEEILAPIIQQQGRISDEVSLAHLHNIQLLARQLGESQARLAKEKAELRKGAKPTPASPDVIKPEIYIDPKEALPLGDSLSSEADIDRFLSRLRAQLLEAVSKGTVFLR